MRFDFLGQIVLGGDRPPVSARGYQPALTVARLVLERPRPLPREELADLLWPTERPSRWEGPARQVVSRARALLVTAGAPSNCITSRGGHVALRLDREIDVDVEVALAETAVAELTLRTQEWDRADKLTEHALERLRLPFFPSSDATWTRRWQDRIRSQLLRALHIAADAALGADAPARTIPFAEEALDLDPFDEVATRALMAAYEALGSRGQALTAYERCRHKLDEDLGVRPSEDTEAAYVALLGTTPRISIRATTANRASARSEPLPFVGRQAELTRLEVDWDAVRDGDTRAVVIAGEPGIGKTRLAAEVANSAQRHGALVLWGACVADVGLPYQPFGELLHQLVTARPAVVDQLGSLATDLASLVPELIEPRDAPAQRADEHARVRLFRAVGAALATIAAEPVLIVLDDLQFADDDALALLRYLTPNLAERPCLLVTTVREAHRSTAATVADIQRRLPTTTLALRGLSVDDLVEVLDRLGVPLTDDVHAVATELATRTTGNPFYVSQLVLDAHASHQPFDPGAVPDAVAQLVARRIDALDGDLASTLALAAVAGGGFELATLEALSSIEPDRLLDAVENLSEQGFLEECGPEQFGFVHALVRDAVLATIGMTRRQRTHRRYAEALAARDADPALLAYHLVAAGPSAAREATGSLLVAGRAALGQAAWTAARDHFSTATNLATDIDERCEALIGLGHAQRALGHAADGRATLELAHSLARAHDRGRAAAQATLALVGGGGRGVAVDLDDAARAALLRDAMDGLDENDLELLVAVMAELALALVLTDAKDERDALTQACLSVARRWNEPSGIAVALQARRIALMGPAGTEERVADARETLALPLRLVAPERVLAAQLGLVEDLLELGDRAGADNALCAAVTLAEQLAHPYWSWATTTWRALIAIIDGRLDTAEALAFEALAYQAPAEHPEAVAALGVNLVDIRLFQGRAAEILDVLRAAAEDNPQIPAYRAVLALCCACGGDPDGARAAYDQLAARDFTLPPDSNWLLGVAVLADTATTLQDHDGARTLTRFLEPYTDRHVVLNCFGGGGAYWGPVAHHLGRLEMLLGHTERARTLLEGAVIASDAIGSTAFAAASQRSLEEMSGARR